MVDFNIQKHVSVYIYTCIYIYISNHVWGIWVWGLRGYGCVGVRTCTCTRIQGEHCLQGNWCGRFIGETVADPGKLSERHKVTMRIAAKEHLTKGPRRAPDVVDSRDAALAEPTTDVFQEALECIILAQDLAKADRQNKVLITGSTMKEDAKSRKYECFEMADTHEDRSSFPFSGKGGG